MQRNTPSGVKYGTTGGPFQSEPLIDNNLQCKPPFRIYYTDGCVEADNEGLNILDYVQHSKCNRVLFRILIGPAPIEGTLMDLFIQSKIHNLLTRVIYFFFCKASYLHSVRKHQTDFNHFIVWVFQEKKIGIFSCMVYDVLVINIFGISDIRQRILEFQCIHIGEHDKQFFQ